MPAVYKGKLNLDKIKGLRADGVTKQIIPFKEDTSLPQPKKAMKTKSNTFRGSKY